jgi:hypothetical protein
MTTTSGSVLNASQSAYARKVEAILRKIDEAPFPGAYIIYAISQGMSPAECVASGMELAL